LVAVFTELLLPHAVIEIPEIVRSIRERTVGQRFLHFHPANSPSAARLKLTGELDPGKFCQGPCGAARAARGAVVVIASVAVVDPLGVNVTLAGLTTQLAFVGAPEQVRATAPLKDAFAARVKVATPPWPCESEIEEELLVSVKAGASAATATCVAVHNVCGLKFASPL
jgi:hypothetical protein